jgi:hypothetical protein
MAGEKHRRSISPLGYGHYSRNPMTSSIRANTWTRDDTGPRADNPARTMLGATQRQWLKRVLAAAQNQGVTWKIVAISSPIDQVGPFGPLFPWDGWKTWIGGYRAGSPQIHRGQPNRTCRLPDDRRSSEPGARAELSGRAGRREKPDAGPGAFTVVAGPIGAVAPDRFTEHDYASVKSVAARLAADERAAGIEPIGLRPDFPGLRQVYREGDPDADATRQPVDFYSADTFNYVTLEISADGKSLAVDTWALIPIARTAFPSRTRSPGRAVFSASGLTPIDRPGRAAPICTDIRRPVWMFFNFMPRWKRPEASRTNARYQQCAGPLSARLERGGRPRPGAQAPSRTRCWSCAGSRSSAGIDHVRRLGDLVTEGAALATTGLQELHRAALRCSGWAPPTISAIVPAAVSAAHQTPVFEPFKLGSGNCSIAETSPRQSDSLL